MKIDVVGRQVLGREFRTLGKLINGVNSMKTRVFVFCAAMACLAAGAALAENGAEAGGGAVSLPEPFGNVRIGAAWRDVAEAWPRAKTSMYAAPKDAFVDPDLPNDLIFVSVPTPMSDVPIPLNPGEKRHSSRVREAAFGPDRPWHWAKFHFKNGTLVSAEIWGRHPRGDAGGPNAPHETATFLSVATLLGEPDEEKRPGEEEGTSHTDVWRRSGATITLKQSFSAESSPDARDESKLFVESPDQVPNEAR